MLKIYSNHNKTHASHSSSPAAFVSFFCVFEVNNAKKNRDG